MASKLFVISGVTRGLGRALATRLEERGHRVVGCGRSAEHIASLQAELGLEHLLQVVDVVDVAAVERWAGEVIDQLGAPDLLVNNAGVINQNARLWRVPVAEFDRVIDVNIKGVANVIRAFLPAMLERGTGVVVNMSSGWGRVTAPEVAPYCATKWAIEGLSRALAQELPSGMAAVALNPGIIHTEMLESCFGAAEARAFPSPESWSRPAADLLLALGPDHNGAALTV